MEKRRVNYLKREQGSGLIIFTAVGAVVALGLFLAVFIAHSRASTPHPKAGLRIPIPSVPILPAITPKPRVFIPTPHPTPQTSKTVTASPSESEL